MQSFLRQNDIIVFSKCNYKVEIDLTQNILGLDLAPRSQKALVEISWCDIKMSTFALKF